ncbi:MAG TPA: hypothetical protein VIG79_14885 [Lapillicoccus sp.]|uniref:hypothetical protein n=1 Tax=Lapillicoccus sp. TaxID=1909287 RepID=UPI002F95E10D
MPSPRLSSSVAVVASLGVLLLTACSADAGGIGGPTTSAPATRTSVPAGWTEDEVTFPSASGTIHASYLHPSSGGPRGPAALLIAGSGQTDRNGDSATTGGTFGTLRALAGMLAAAGVPSLRYDKLGTGATGRGSVTDLSTVGVGTFSDEAGAALGYLAGRPDADPARLVVIGHSEGSLFAQLLATGGVPGAPTVHAVALLEPLSHRFLDVVTAQITGQVATARSAGQMTAEQGDQFLGLLASAVRAVRAGQPVPSLPPELAPLFLPQNTRYLREIDATDPVVLGGQTPAGMPVLVTGSDADIQVPIADAQALAAAIPGSTFLAQHGVSHVLKVDPSTTIAHYGDDLPYSPELTAALATFVGR